MLIIGDIIINSIEKKYPIKSIEIVCCQDNISHVETLLNLKSGEKVDNITKIYKNEGKPDVIVYNADRDTGLMDLLLYTRSNSKIFKYIPATLQFAIQQIPLTYEYRDVKQWSHEVQGLNILNRYLGNNLNILSVSEEIKGLSSALFPWKIKDIKILSISKPKYPKFTVYTAQELLKMVTRLKSPAYEAVWESSDFRLVSNMRFLSATSFKKLQAALERLYVDTLNDYIVNHPRVADLSGDEVFNYFLLAYMTACRDTRNKRFTSYLLTHYDRIMDLFLMNFYHNFKMFEIYGD